MFRHDHFVYNNTSLLCKIKRKTNSEYGGGSTEIVKSKEKQIIEQLRSQVSQMSDDLMHMRETNIALLRDISESEKRTFSAETNAYNSNERLRMLERRIANKISNGQMEQQMEQLGQMGQHGNMPGNMPMVFNGKNYVYNSSDGLKMTNARNDLNARTSNEGLHQDRFLMESDFNLSNDSSSSSSSSSSSFPNAMHPSNPLWNASMVAASQSSLPIVLAAAVSSSSSTPPLDVYVETASFSSMKRRREPNTCRKSYLDGHPGLKIIEYNQQQDATKRQKMNQEEEEGEEEEDNGTNSPPVEPSYPKNIEQLEPLPIETLLSLPQPIHRPLYNMNNNNTTNNTTNTNMNSSSRKYSNEMNEDFLIHAPLDALFRSSVKESDTDNEINHVFNNEMIHQEKEKKKMKERKTINEKDQDEKENTEKDRDEMIQIQFEDTNKEKDNVNGNVNDDVNDVLNRLPMYFLQVNFLSLSILSMYRLCLFPLTMENVLYTVVESIVLFMLLLLIGIHKHASCDCVSKRMKTMHLKWAVAVVFAWITFTVLQFVWNTINNGIKENYPTLVLQANGTCVL